jgi:oligopeptide/dipeptide ABC transporter ATP-binding protein
MGSLLSVEGLKTIIQTLKGSVRAVDGLNFTIEEGESVGLVGESGCGKSMTALSIIRLVPPVARITEGKILFKGENLLDLPEKKMAEIRGKEIAMTFQDPMTFLNPVMRLGKQIAEPMVAHSSASNEEALDRAIGILSKVGFGDPAKMATRYRHELSGGMRQRGLLGMSLACSPSLLILDEPTTALDATTQLQLIALLKKIRSQTKAAMLVISHDLGVIAELCDRVCVMYAGEIVEEGSVNDVFASGVHQYTKGLLQSVQSLFEGGLFFIEGEVPNLIDPLTGCKFHSRCKLASARCSTSHPPMLEVSNGHLASCWSRCA